MMAKKVTGKKLNQKWGVGAKHALYREDGGWYHLLKNFPAALFDANGYVVSRASRYLLTPWLCSCEAVA